jgi:hypothetical protein
MTAPVDYSDVEWLLERHSQFHKEYRHIESEYLELRILLRDVETALRTDPENEGMRLRVYYLKRRLERLEEKYPWLISENPPEVAFWAAPSG